MHRVVSFSLAGVLVVGGLVAVAAVLDGDDEGPVVAAPAATAAEQPAATEPLPAVGGGPANSSGVVAAGRPRPRRATTTTAAPATTDPPGPPTPDPASCPSSDHGAVIDRAFQRAWLCRDGSIDDVFPITTAVTQPDPGTYDVYAKDLQTTSYFGDRPSTLDRFVAFTRGKYTGARIAFHAIPRYSDGTLAQSPETVGSPELFGESSGCIRVLPDDAVAIWDFLAIGDQVRVIS